MATQKYGILKKYRNLNILLHCNWKSLNDLILRSYIQFDFPVLERNYRWLRGLVKLVFVVEHMTYFTIIIYWK